MESWQAGLGSVMLRMMFDMETLTPDSHVHFDLAHAASLNIVEDSSWQQYSPIAVTSFSRIICPVIQQVFF